MSADFAVPTEDSGLTFELLLADPARHILAVDAALNAVYGSPVLHPDLDPLGGLVATVLSQSTSDTNSGRAYTNLRLSFPTWEDVRTAPRAAIADAIRSGGIAELKSARIQQILELIRTRYGTLSLDSLRALSLAEARAELTSLPGVGPKTAACVLLFNLGQPAFPVDTHVHRLSHRLGFAPARAGPARVQELVEASIPPARVYPLHVNLITHGRRTCKAQRPRCTACALRPLCRFGIARAYGAPDGILESAGRP